jgi:hypothetical protein
MIAWHQSQKKQQRAFKARRFCISGAKQIDSFPTAAVSFAATAAGPVGSRQASQSGLVCVIFAPLSSWFPKLLHFALHLRVRRAGFR